MMTTEPDDHQIPPVRTRPSRTDLLGLGPEDFSCRVGTAMEAHGEPAYRTEQLRRWVFDRKVRSLDEATTLPKELRSVLRSEFSLTPLEPAHVARSRDGTVKHLWRLEDGEHIESVLIPTSDRLTLCLSSQAGCALGCLFCATGHFGFRRQLSAAEIAAQFRDAARFARSEWARAVDNVVFMGMGEPLANLEAVHGSLDVLHGGFGVGARRITVSTVGLVPGILELARRSEQFGLAVSLHAPDHDLRARLMPIERRYPLPELFEAIREYARLRGRRITFEYTLIDGVNDATTLAGQLASLLRGLSAFVNLIPLNPIPHVDWQPSPPERVAAFAETLRARGVEAAVRTPRGRDIAAACGQLRLESDQGIDSGNGASGIEPR
ncbi:MAG: 23S rRNA (adenine(2503)-C(2))-methyltransferase RlmN [Gemmatimonadales bacterium]|jgi:23S rRNA (adenine2503-C2)-methyltransferase